MDKLDTEDDKLKEAYFQTDYYFTECNNTIVIRLDEKNPALLSYLNVENITAWAYLTAWNPLSNPYSDTYNHVQQQLLLERLQGFKTIKGEGKGRDGNWPAEESYFVVGISRENAMSLGRHFEQNAILVSGKDLEPQLVYPLVK